MSGLPTSRHPLSSATFIEPLLLKSNSSKNCGNGNVDKNSGDVFISKGLKYPLISSIGIVSSDQ